MKTKIAPKIRWAKEGPAKFVLATGETISVVLEARGDWIAWEGSTVWATPLGPFNPQGWSCGDGRRVVEVIQEELGPPLA